MSLNSCFKIKHSSKPLKKIFLYKYKMTDNQQQSGVTVNQLASLVNGINVAQKRSL